jgi:hypothetical protein
MYKCDTCDAPMDDDVGICYIPVSHNTAGRFRKFPRKPRIVPREISRTHWPSMDAGWWV